jgi:UDP-N-acetylglucosamine 2-epimerase (non-hydrolysing)
MLNYITPELHKKLEKTKSKIVHIIIVATKPDIIKQAPLYQELKDRGEFVIICHTDQHYDFRYSGGVEEEFKLKIDIHLGISGDLNSRLSQMVERFGEVLDYLMERGMTPIPYIHGDTGTALAIGLGSILKRVACVHVEAGIRTLTPTREVYHRFYDAFKKGKFVWEDYYKALQIRDNLEMGSLEPYPEQVDTRMSESASGFYATPVELTREFLIAEGFSKSKIAVVGNSVADAVAKSKNEVKNSTIFDTHPKLKNGKFIQFIMHRRENVQDEVRFNIIIETVEKLVKSGKSVFMVSLFAFEAALDKYNKRQNIEQLVKDYPETFIYSEAITYHRDMVKLMLNSPVVVIDSGSQQEELNVLGIPCVTLRFGTDRGETILAGSNILAPPIDSDFIVAIIEGAYDNKKMRSVGNIYGTKVSKKIVDETLKRVRPGTGLFITEEQRLGFDGHKFNPAENSKDAWF